MEVANTIAAIEEGATRIDGSVRCLGAGGGNTQIEVLLAVLRANGYRCRYRFIQDDGWS